MSTSGNLLGKRMNLFKGSYKSLARRCNFIRNKAAKKKNKAFIPYLKDKAIKIESSNPDICGSWKSKRLNKYKEKIREIIINNNDIDINIQLLKAYSIFVTPENQFKYKRKRNAGSSKLVYKVPCFVCKAEEAYCNHHIQLLTNGGGNQDYNLIPICLNCHKKIHDWF